MSKKINLRNTQNFITKVFKHDCYKVSHSFEPKERIKNIAWPSEALAQSGTRAIGECKRALFYKIIGATPSEPMNVIGKGICDAGLMFEDYFIKKFKNYNMLVDEQVPIKFNFPKTENEITCIGRMDAVIKYEGVKRAIEMKSVGAYKAPDTMGNSRTRGLPATKNLMQAMLYKYYTSKTEEGKKLDIDEVYLMYINRSDGTVFYYRVDLDDDGYAIITSYDQTGKEIETIRLQNVPSFDDLIQTPGNHSKEDSRLAELKISIYDIFSKFDMVYNYAKNKMLPEPDYNYIYNESQLDEELRLGNLSKVKYNKAKKGEPVGDSNCKYCSYFSKCLEDSGIKLK